jgi:hypothetical protein
MVIILSAIFGAMIGLLHGFKFPAFWKFKGYHLKPILKKIHIPPIIGMIIMGCVVRNAYTPYMKAYPTGWAQWIRSCCLAVLLVRGGMNVSFRGKGLLVLFMSFIPQTVECVTIALIAYGLFGTPIEVSFAMGYAVATVAPAIVVPQLMRWNEAGWGRSKGIAGSLIASCTFDNIIALICFGICKSIIFDYAARARGEASQNMALSIGMLFVHNVAGLIAGVIMGLLGWFFKYI